MSKTEEELKKLADRGRAIKDKQDVLDVELDKIKVIFREEAKSRKVGYFVGYKHFVRVSPQSGTTCESKELHNTLVEVGRGGEFYECVKVLITDAKAKLGETLFNSISTTKSEAYKKVSFLKAIPKKYLE